MSQVVVSQQTGYARNASESAYPNLWRGLVGWWCPSVHFRGGQKVFDLSTYSNHGLFDNPAAGGVSTVAWVLTNGYGSLSFPATEDQVRMGRPPSFTGNCTWSVWFRHTATGADQALITTRNIFTGASRNGISSYLRGANTNTVSVEFTISGTRYTADVASGSTADGAWRCLIGRRINGRTIATLFGPGNGLLAYSTATSAGTSTSAITHEVGATLGAWRDYATGRFAVNIDDARIWNRGLSDAECRLVASRRGIGLERSFKRKSREDVVGFANPVLFYNHYVNQGFF